MRRSSEYTMAEQPKNHNIATILPFTMTLTLKQCVKFASRSENIKCALPTLSWLYGGCCVSCHSFAMTLLWLGVLAHCCGPVVAL